jgi:hypothetical protein
MDHAWFFLWVVLANFLIRPILTLWYVNTKPNAMIASEIFAHSDRSGIEEGTTAMKCPNATGLCPTKMIFSETTDGPLKGSQTRFCKSLQTPPGHQARIIG